LTSNTTPVLVPSVGFPSNFLDPSTVNLNVLNAYHIRAMALHDPLPYVQQWSFGVQRQIGQKWAGEVDYVGTRSTHLDVIRNYNQPIISGGESTGDVPYTNLARLITPCR